MKLNSLRIRFKCTSNSQEEYTAVGNIVAANDTEFIVSPFLSDGAVKVIEDTLDVNV